MSGTKDCPKCGLVNPPDAQRCDCGYDFAARAMRASYATPGGPTSTSGCARAAGLLCLGLAGLSFVGGLLAAATVPNVAAGDAEALGRVAGGFCPSLLLLIVGIFLVRPRR